MRLRFVIPMLVLCVSACERPPEQPSYRLDTVTRGLEQPTGLWASAEGIFVSTSRGLVLLEAEAPPRLFASRKPPIRSMAGIAMQGDRVLVADPEGNRVWSLGQDAQPTAFAGTGTSLFPLGDGGLATSAQLNSPRDVALQGYIADTGNDRIRQVVEGRINTVVDGLSRPAAIALGSDGSLAIADTGNHAIKILKDGAVSTLAGGTQGYADGRSASARFNAPEGIAVAPDGTIYVADTGNARIRRVAQGQVTTIAGGGSRREDGMQPATEAALTGPGAIATIDETVYLLDGDALYRLSPM